MALSRGRRWSLAAVGGAVAAVLVVVQASSSSGGPTIVVRGQVADPETFSLTTLQSQADRDLVQSAQQSQFQVCMRARGFEEAPEPESDAYNAYARAAYGDDGDARPPQPQTVPIAPGVEREIRIDWTPDTCAFQSYETLGVDPIQAQALWLAIQELQVKADIASADELGSALTDWGECLGVSDPDAFTLFRTLDGRDLSHSPYGQESTGCLSAGIAQSARGVRAREHIQMAASNEAIVQAWIELLDTEASKAREIMG